MVIQCCSSRAVHGVSFYDLASEVCIASHLVAEHLLLLWGGTIFCYRVDEISGLGRVSFCCCL